MRKIKFLSYTFMWCVTFLLVCLITTAAIEAVYFNQGIENLILSTFIFIPVMITFRIIRFEFDQMEKKDERNKSRLCYD